MASNGQGLNDSSLLEVMRTVCIKRHVASDSTQLDLEVDDVVFVVEQDETGWWGGSKENEDSTGWFPGNCVRPAPLDPSPAVDGSPLASPIPSAATGDPIQSVVGSPIASPIQSVVGSPAASPSPIQPGTGAHDKSQIIDSSFVEEAARDTGAAPEDKGSQCIRSLSPKAETPSFAALHTDQDSPLRRRRIVASPQFRSGLGAGEPEAGSAILIPGTPEAASSPLSGAVADIFAGRRAAAEEALVSENAKLKQEKEELSNVLQKFKRQSDAERMQFAEIEGKLQKEREKLERAERQLKNEEMQKSSLASEAQALRETLREAQALAEVQCKTALREQREAFEDRLQRKEEELRVVQENRRKSDLRTRHLEEMLERSAQKEKSDREQHEIIERPQQERVPCEEDRSNGNGDELPVEGSVKLRRQLFSGGGASSAASLNSAAAEAAPETARRSVTPPPTTCRPLLAQPQCQEHTTGSVQPPAPTGTGPRPGPQASSARWGSTGSNSMAVSPRIAAAQESLKQHTRSTGDLAAPSQRQQRRSGSNAPCGGSLAIAGGGSPPVAATVVVASSSTTARTAPTSRDSTSPAREEEEPRPGTVLAVRSMFEQRCQTPRREAGTPGQRGGRAPSVEASPATLTRFRLSSGQDRTRPVPPAMPKAPLASLAPKAQLAQQPPSASSVRSAPVPLTATAADASGFRSVSQQVAERSQVFMGMSPMGGSRDLLDSHSQSFPASATSSYSSLMKVPATEPTGSFQTNQSRWPRGMSSSAASLDTSGQETTPPKQRALRRESSIPEVSVQERIRSMQLW